MGIATGRGKSVRKVLRECLAPAVWQQVIIAYHNGSQIGTLDDQMIPVDSNAVGPTLAAVAERLEGSFVLKSLAKPEYRTSQVTIAAKNPVDMTRLHKLVCDLAALNFTDGVSCLRSSHSVDVLAPGVGKQALFATLTQKVRSTGPKFLCIGDLGSWPGNDFSLLWMPHSLSVNEVSSIPDRCWNIAPPGYRNSQATRYLLERMTVSRGTLRLHTDLLGKAGKRR